ncbi:DUF3253 domain-containing protein [Prosthecomicrobium pneumaticum]|uniref:DUF3253 domain-containing protein n=1 Tax=Prosthecomicrobium pneumaticum TaxID=81895 RepID=A0A7W9FP11_9HYPH|nr:DUF3253 domain-containing protein [Prosthecomicrobium pneumaticum]MBB5754172.1 hypothetical protein [Prosthecomicrobium pneumaticum]
MTARPAEADIRETMLRLVAEAGPEGTASPEAVARALAGSDPKAWSKLMPAVRRAAVSLALAGALSIRRKGRPVDPKEFKGVYRLGPPAA